jgi:uncharacterized protein
MTSHTVTLKSRIAKGTLRHRRFTPIHREFSHSVTYFFLALDEIPRLFRVPLLFSHHFPSLFRFNRKIYFEGKGPQSLDESLRARIQKELHFLPDGPIFVLTQISSFGIGFNPVSFYFFYSSSGEQLIAILSEITNTPWGERHAYVHDCRPGMTGAKQFQFPKRFHVSPFLGMDYNYAWSFAVDPSKRITIHMSNHDQNESAVADRKHFDATLTLELQPIHRMKIISTLSQSPLMVLRTLLLIYAHALILFVRRVPFYPHPKNDFTSQKGVPR